MKSLDQIDQHVASAGERRIDALTVSGGNKDLHLITVPGSYYLSANLAGVAGKNGIKITVPNVTLDLNGFTVSGVGPLSSEIGIIATTAARIVNGRVDHWGTAMLTSLGCVIEHVIASNNGQGFDVSYDTMLSSCVAHGNAAGGFTAGDGTSLSHCDFFNNGVGGNLALYCRVDSCTFSFNNDYGLSFGNGCQITDSVASGNLGSGFLTPNGKGVVLSRCSAVGNTLAGIVLSANASGALISDCSLNGNVHDGIYALGTGHLIRNCAVTGNAKASGNGMTIETYCSVKDCIVYGNGSDTNGANGISGGIRTLVSGCNVNKNTRSGIAVAGDSTLRDNRSSENGEHGIDTSFGTGSRIEGNQTRNNFNTGIVASFDDIVIRNESGGNGTQFSPSSGTNFGTLQTPNTSTNPMANIGY